MASNVQKDDPINVNVENTYGVWDSPISSAMASGSSMRFGGVAVDGEDRLLWVEGRPTEKGRCVLVREGSLPSNSPPLPPHEILPSNHPGVRTRVNEYGGAAFTVKGSQVIFSNASDQRLYTIFLNNEAPDPVPLTPECSPSGALRFADGCVDHSGHRIICVEEDHRHSGATAPASSSLQQAASGHQERGEEESDSAHEEPAQRIVGVPLSVTAGQAEPAEPQVLVSGADFYAFPRVSPDGHQLAWVEWSHPHMPWDRTRLMVGRLLGDSGAGGGVTDVQCIAGGEAHLVEAPLEPMWADTGDLFFVSDRHSGFWTVHKWDAQDGQVKQVGDLPVSAEVGQPMWILGNSSFAFCPVGGGEEGSSRHIVSTYQMNGAAQLAIINTGTGSVTVHPTPFTTITNLIAGTHRLFCLAGSPTIPLGLYELVVSAASDSSSLTLSVKQPPIWQSLPVDLPALQPFLSVPRWIEFSTSHPAGKAYALFYPPCNTEATAPSGSLPPLLVLSHGGPTGCLDSSLRLALQFWTSRGWAVADVNYRGSTGYGRAYREQLYGQWGIADVDDCCSCAQYCVSQGLVDPHQLVIRGSSAGGFTTLAALTFKDTFKAGISLYGIGDLEALASDTHKFEKHYTDTLVAKFSTEEGKAEYRKRSPIQHIDRLACPILLFQGLKDMVVLPSQSRAMYDAVKTKGLPVALVEFEDEGHGFRNAVNLQKVLEYELEFLKRVMLGVKVPAGQQDLVIDNLKE